jgi:drug/metabolite transporter (DMT)-like permease
MKHPITSVQAFFVVLSVSGILMIFTRNSPSFDGRFLGTILLFLSALSSALFTIVLKKTVSKLSIYELTFIILLVGFTVFNTVYIFEQYESQGFVLDYLRPFGSLSYTLGILYLSLFASLGSTFVSNYAIQDLSPPQFSVFSNLSTLISIIAGALILHESLSPAHYLGSAFILAGVIGTNFSQSIEYKLNLAFKKT